jgi:hypothetical protein
MARGHFGRMSDIHCVVKLSGQIELSNGVVKVRAQIAWSNLTT